VEEIVYGAHAMHQSAIAKIARVDKKTIAKNRRELVLAFTAKRVPKKGEKDAKRKEDLEPKSLCGLCARCG
jgi:hypothetical protein